MNMTGTRLQFFENCNPAPTAYTHMPHTQTQHSSPSPHSLTSLTLHSLTLMSLTLSNTQTQTQNTKNMADKYFVYVIAEMDRLWFHQVILFSKPTPPLPPKPNLPLTQSLSFSSSILSLPYQEDESQQLSSESISLPLQDGSFDNKEETKEDKMNLLVNRTRSHSSSPSSYQNHRRKLKKQQASSKRKLQKSMSCRTLGELEHDEVKGFMDLGFIFKKENLSPRMISVVPGLQRLGLYQNKQNTKLIINENETERSRVRGNDDDKAEEEKRFIMRPYLSEAWLIKRPDSQLLNLKIPKSCSASNMKKHLRFWAKTVASEICQE